MHGPVALYCFQGLTFIYIPLEHVVFLGLGETEALRFFSFVTSANGEYGKCNPSIRIEHVLPVAAWRCGDVVLTIQLITRQLSDAAQCLGRNRGDEYEQRADLPDLIGPGQALTLLVVAGRENHADKMCIHPSKSNLKLQIGGRSLRKSSRLN